MLRELFRIPFIDWPVYGYGLMLVLGVWAGIELGKRLFAALGLNGDDFVTLGVLGLVSGVVGARLSHVLENLGTYTDPDRSVGANLAAAVNITGGGLTFYGGFIVATVTLLIYGRLKGLPIRLSIDVVAPCLMIGLAFGRVGCLLNGCCWGQTCHVEQVPWAITFPYDAPTVDHQLETGQLTVGEDVPRELVGVVRTDRGPIATTLDARDVAADPRLAELAKGVRSLPVHPTQVYSVLNALLIAASCLAYLTTRPAPGRVFALMLLMYGPSRFALETLRVNTRLAGDLTYSMWVSIGVTAAGVLLWLAGGVLARRMASRTSETSPAASSTTVA